MLFLKLFLVAAFIGSMIWLVVDLDYKSISAVIITAGSLLAIRVNAHAQKDKREFEPNKH
ncbi:MAG TPA: hypothetical protein VK958_07375 [Methylophilus sp.]|uniref:hypothetical protein n=1 Tax=Methylophilus sp. TaxID=29541 RepID=UPI002BC65A16|nr:hypothetical protein [Methylophilus sp.]HSH87052.1 hypothetical protein [Methylophilus sp.]